MKTFHSIQEFNCRNHTVVTIGTFDGVHKGHESIIKNLVQNTSKSNYESVLLTFFPHPRIILNQEENIKLLNTLKEKIIILENLGVNNLIIQPFTKEFSQLSANDFVEQVLVNKLKCKKIIVGYDHRFGNNREASVKELIEFGNKFNFDVEEISAKQIKEISISSTKIRNALLQGNVEDANNYLGYPYSLSGKIVKGKQVGRTINFRTANIEIDENYKLIPKEGVYAVKVFIKNKEHLGMMNIGKNPTVNLQKQSVEVHIFNFDEDIYNENIKVTLFNYLREEKKFSDLMALQNQLTKDKIQALNLLQ